jgi:hypothetical protein
MIRGEIHEVVGLHRITVATSATQVPPPQPPPQPNAGTTGSYQYEYRKDMMTRLDRNGAEARSLGKEWMVGNVGA